MTRRAFAIFIGIMIAVGVGLAQVPGIFATLTADSLSCTTAGCALTNVPTAPTAAPGTNTTQIATTAFVTGAAGALPTVQAASFTTGFCQTPGAEEFCTTTAGFSWPTAFTGTYYVVCQYTGVSGSGTNPGMYPPRPTSLTTTNFQIIEQAGSNSAGGTNTPTGMYCIGVQP